MIKKKRLVFLLIAVLCLVIFVAVAYAKTAPLKLLVFHSPSCVRCLEVKKNDLPEIENRYKARVEIEYYDVTDINNYKFLMGLNEKYKPNIELTLPIFFIQGKFLNGKVKIDEVLPKLIDESIGSFTGEENKEGLDLVKYFSGLSPLVILGAGLIDGVNPCAFTVIVFFISYLALQGYRKRQLAVIGATFIISVFTTYTLIGLGLFNFLYRLNSFWLFTKIFNIFIGILSLSLGFIALYDLFRLKKTQDTDDLVLQLPKSIKNRIHSVIGWHYRRDKRDLTASSNFSFLRLVISALITGFLVSLLEAVCTGQLYLPTIAIVLKTSSLKFQALIYLILYNIMFILPLFAIFILALFGITSMQFAGFLKKNLTIFKVIIAGVFFILGFYLLWRV
jgi:MFS family permease